MSKLLQSLLFASALLLSGCQQEAPAQRAQAAVVFQVYKSPSCGCCEGWIQHLEHNGISSNAQHPDDLNALKLQLGIAPRYQSCHTAVSPDGFVFEGHIPASAVRDFLADTPADAIGLAVPGMPVGSPGMEMDNRFMPYDVLLLKKDGSSEVYRHIASADRQ